MRSTKIDRVITRVSGSTDYMGDISKITGNINTVDKEYYMSRLKIVENTFNVIIKELQTHANKSETLDEFAELLLNQYNILELQAPYKKRTNNNGGKVRYKLRLSPRNIYESMWFTNLRNLETTAASLTEQFDIEGIKITDKQEKIFKEQPELVRVYTFYDLPLTDPTVYQTVYICHRYTNKILEIILSPAYDAKNYIVNHWLPQIDEIIGSKIESEEDMTRSDIQNFVYTFVLAKYRLDLTSNSEEFTKVLLQSMSENNIAEMDAGRFLNIIEGINLDKLDKKENIYKFAEATKTEIQKIVSGEKVNPSEILKDIERILDTGAEDDIEEATSEVEDIF